MSAKSLAKARGQLSYDLVPRARTNVKPETSTQPFIIKTWPNSLDKKPRHFLAMLDRLERSVLIKSPVS